MRVYRITRCATTLGDTRYSIEKFSLLGYVKGRGLRNTITELMNGVLSFNPYKLRRKMGRLRKLDKLLMIELMRMAISNRV